MEKFISIHTSYATPAWRINGGIYPKDGQVPEDGSREDGYEVRCNDGCGAPIFIPKDRFENIYRSAKTVSIRLLTPEKHPANLNFGDAVEFLRTGYMVKRAGWQTKSTFVVKQVPTRVSEEIIPNMRSLPYFAKKHILGTTQTILYSDQCLIIDSLTGRADSWSPTMEDIFAEDWRVIE